MSDYYILHHHYTLNVTKLSHIIFIICYTYIIKLTSYSFCKNFLHIWLALLTLILSKTIRTQAVGNAIRVAIHASRASTAPPVPSVTQSNSLVHIYYQSSPVTVL
jgi:hypothetical protein